MATEHRTVGERGQVTIPKRVRDRLGIEGGDEVVVREEDGRVVIETPVTASDLAEGYRARATRDRDLAAELEAVSREAGADVGPVPEWEE